MHSLSDVQKAKLNGEKVNVHLSAHEIVCPMQCISDDTQKA